VVAGVPGSLVGGSDVDVQRSPDARRHELLMPVGRLTADGITASGLSRSFGEERAVDVMDLTVRPGEIHALVGLNGAGKTTLMRLLLGMLRPDRGTVTILGSRVGRDAAGPWARVGHTLDSGFGYPELTAFENVRCAALLRGMRAPASRSAADHALEDLGLARWRDRPARQLSSGNRQRLGLACALFGRPDVLVLDEPTTALDPAGIVLVRTLLEQAADGGAAVLVSSHHLDEMARIADPISVMHRGRIVGALDPAGTDLERTFFDLVLSADRAAEEPS
jgi:ABC-2 type transport system ATP-binding protein